MLINLKVKTLDAQTHDFSIDNEITVREFKDKIAEKTNIAADQQRIIYCGRVLADDKPIKDYDVDGKVVHVAERPPPSQRAASSSSSNSNANDGGTPRERPTPRIGMRNSPFFRALDGMVVGTMAIPMNGNMNNVQMAGNPFTSSSTFCMNRITVARHMLECANNIAAYLENPERGLNNTSLDILTRGRWTMESTVVEVGITASDIPQNQNIVEMVQGAVSAALRHNGNTNVTVVQLPTVFSSNENETAGDGGNTTAGGNAVMESESTSAAVIIEEVMDSEEEGATNASNVAQAGSIASNSNSNSSTGTATTAPTLMSMMGDGNNTSTSTGTNTEDPTQPQRRTGTRVLAEVIQQMRTVQTRLGPFVQQFYELLENEPTFEQNDTTGRENMQRLFDRVSEALHYMSHAQHAISDLMLDVSQPAPRYLTCRPIMVEQSGYISSNNYLSAAAAAAAAVRQHQQQPLAQAANAVAAAAAAAAAAANAGAAAADAATAAGAAAAAATSAADAATTAAAANERSTPSTTSTSSSTAASRSASSTSLPTSRPRNANAASVEDPIDDPIYETLPYRGSADAAAAGNHNNNINNDNHQMQMARLIQAVVNSAPIDTEFHVQINTPSISIGVPLNANANAGEAVRNANANARNQATTGATTATGATTTQSPRNATTASTTTAAAAAAAAAPVSSSTSITGGNSNMPQTRSNTATLPTTSTQTRSTSRPQLQIGNIPGAGWNGRFIPTNMMSSFDRFLPCNSHHISEPAEGANSQNGNPTGTAGAASTTGGAASGAAVATGATGAAPTSAAAAASAAATGAAPSVGGSSGGVGAGAGRASAATAGAAGTTANRNRQIPFNSNFRLRPVPTAGDASALHHAPAPSLGFSMVVRTVVPMAGHSYEYRRNLREQLLNFITQDIFAGEPVNEQATPSAIERAIRWFNDKLIYLPQYERAECDARQSVLNVVRCTMQYLVDIFADNRDGDDLAHFETRLKQTGEVFITRLYSVLYVSTGPVNAELFWTQLMRLLQTSVSSKFRDEALEFLRAFLNLDVVDIGLDSTDAGQFVVYRNAARRDASPVNMEVEVDNDVGVGVGVVGEDRSIGDNDEGIAAAQLPTVVPGSEPWHRSFPNEWLPIITRDMQIQSETSSNQAPYSDAYISGMSVKRKKIMQSTKPATDVRTLLAGNVRRAMQTVGVTASTASNQSHSIDEIANAIANDNVTQLSYAEAVRGHARDRTLKDPNYKPEKFPFTTKFVNK